MFLSYFFPVKLCISPSLRVSVCVAV